jgi:BMFP domain-containing protein YqiC
MERNKLWDDLAGVAGGAFSIAAGLRAEAEAVARAQSEAMIQRLDLARREEVEAAMEVARRAREQAEALEARVAALEALLVARATPPAAESRPFPLEHLAARLSGTITIPGGCLGRFAQYPGVTRALRRRCRDAATCLRTRPQHQPPRHPRADPRRQ